MKLLDVNLLIYAVDEDSPFHAACLKWLTRQLGGERRGGLPWQSLSAFLRVVTHPRAARNPLAPSDAWQLVEEWLAREITWVTGPTPQHARILGELIGRYQLRGNLIPDAHLAALAIEHGIELCSADTDFARFTEIRWRNPLASA